MAVRTKEKDGYIAVQLGVGRAKTKNVSQPMRGHFAKAKVEPKRRVEEFRVSEDAVLDVGDELHVGPLRGRPVRRCRRGEHRQGLRGCDEAA